MKARSVFICAILVMLCGYGAVARFVRLLTEAVPISRVLANFEKQLLKDPNNVETLYHLARIHSMAYATNLAVVNIITNSPYFSQWPMFEHPGADTAVPDQVTHYSDPMAQAGAQRHLTNAIAYYQQAASMAFKGTNALKSGQLIVPIHLGLAWCLDQSGRREDAIKAYRRALKFAWKSEVDPDLSFQEQLEWSWDQVRAGKNPISKPRGHLGPGICYSEEIIGYLLKLLDPVKDAKEIAQLKKDKAALASMGRAVTPIFVPLRANAPLEELVNPAANVAFDLDGSGIPRHWGWITPKAAWLVYDHDGSGRITSGLQMFGNVTFWIFWRDGYDALSALDDDGDGTLRGPELRGLCLWQDLNGNGICDPGEVRPVTDWGIVAIECRGQLHPMGIPFNSRGVIFRDGTTRPSYDWIAPSSAPANVP